MQTRSKSFYTTLTFILLLSLTILPMQDLSILTSAVTGARTTSLSEDDVFLSSRPGQAELQNERNYPADPSADIPWSAGTNGVADIQAAFNNARTQENNQLGTSIPMLTLPSQAEWNGMSDGQKALWLINRERIDRGVPPLHGLETNVGGVAQYYADYLLDNNTWGHTADGRDPWERLSDNPAIGACHDFLSVSENLAVFVTSASSIPLPIERAIYMWMYEDGSCCGWGHRHAILWYPYNDNGGPAAREGFLGIGRANGGPYKGPFSQSWPLAEIIVMNVFDPCANWAYAEPPGAASPISPSGTITNHSPVYRWNVSSDTDTTNPATYYLLRVQRPSGAPIQTWYEASAVCSGGTCSVEHPTALGSGAHTWFIRTWNAAGYGPWSTGMNFTVAASPAPGAANPTSPSGSITDNTPEYAWNAVSGTEWYLLWVNAPSGNGFVQAWYSANQAGCAAGTGACSATPGKGLVLGSHTFYIRTWNRSGYGPWSSGLSFNVTMPPRPGAGTPVSPDSNTNDDTPTYTWNAASDVEWYFLWVDSPSGSGFVRSWWSANGAGCGAGTGTCSVTPGKHLPPGNHTWYIRTWNRSGYGPWSSGLSFTVSP